MIVPSAPPVLLFSLERAISEDEVKELATLTASHGLTEKQIERKNKILEKKYVNSPLLSWIPIPVGTVITPFVPDSYKTTTIKRIEMAGSVPILRQSMNTETITFTSSSSIFINAMIFALDFMFQKANSFPSIKYFSNDMIILNGHLLNFTHSKKESSTQQMISIEIQKGNVDKVVKVKPSDDVAKKQITTHAEGG